MSTAPTPSPWPGRWQRLSAAAVRGFHAYAGWLVGISWKRFVVLSVLLLVVAAVLNDLPPFSWRYRTRVSPPRRVVAEVPAPPAAPVPPKPPTPSRSGDIDVEKLERLRKLADGLDIRIDASGVHITGRPRTADPAASGASAASAASAAATAASAASASRGVGVDVALPPNASSSEVVAAVEEARQAIEEAVRDAGEAAGDIADAHRDVAAAGRDAAQAARDAVRNLHRNGGDQVDDEGYVTKEVRVGDFLPGLALFWIFASAIVKITYKRQIAAEAQAAQAVETAEAESLKRQVVEARMAAMQAQVEPHFLFNTLASIDHLIEVDPPRASQMQKNLIALLRASMPTMRETAAGQGAGARDLGRELAVIRPYLEILKVRMEERLETAIDVPEGLQSAEFPPMMVQTLVENAIKHGLEPKPEGGRLTVKAEVLHGKLAVSVADTGLGFGKAATAGTGVGLANIRERLQLLYGTRAGLAVTENPGGGTRVTITVPYRPLADAANA